VLAKRYYDVSAGSVNLDRPTSRFSARQRRHWPRIRRSDDGAQAPTPAFEATVALAAIKGEKARVELAQRFMPTKI
jgi:hypothetical protein